MVCFILLLRWSKDGVEGTRMALVTVECYAALSWAFVEFRVVQAF